MFFGQNDALLQRRVREGKRGEERNSDTTTCERVHRDTAVIVPPLLTCLEL